MRLLILLTFACEALALVIGPARLPADKQAVDGGDASLNLEKAVLADHEITRRDEEALQSLEKRVLGITMPNIILPKTAAPAAMIFDGLKITFTMALHWVQKESGDWVYEHYVQSMQLLNQLNRRIAVEIVAAGQKLLDTHLSSLAESTVNTPEGTETFNLFISEIDTEL